MGPTETIAAIATPAGQGGIGIVRISGPAAPAIAQCICGALPPPRRIKTCSFKDQAGAVIDKGILLYFRAPASYTGEDVIELQGHGGPVVMAMLLKSVIACGARQARPGEFTERALLNDKLDLNQAEAVAELISSRSEQAARNALAVLDGAFSQLIEQLLQQLLEARAYVESLLDFPEEDLGGYIADELAQRIQHCERAIDRLLAQSRQGRLCAKGLQLAIIGRPNSGKSTLLNRLSGTERAIITDQPGTTRDTLHEDILIDNIPCRLIDTAGIRHATDEIEAAGIRRAISVAGQADIILHVIDISIVDQDNRQHGRMERLIKGYPPAKLIHVFNKIDLLDKQAAATEADVYLSAQTGAGLALLRRLIVRRAGAASIDDAGNDSCFAAQQRHVAVLETLQVQLQTAWQGFAGSQALELLADDLKAMQQQLAAITGEFAADDLLGEIFSRFCIGK